MAKSRNVRQCRRCGCRKTKVVNCRQNSGIMRRVRECGDCGNRWTTVEIDERWFELMLDTLNRSEGVLRAAETAMKAVSE